MAVEDSAAAAEKEEETAEDAPTEEGVGVVLPAPEVPAIPLPPLADGGVDPAAVLPLLPAAVAAASRFKALPPVDADPPPTALLLLLAVIIEGIVMDALEIMASTGIGVPDRAAIMRS